MPFISPGVYTGQIIFNEVQRSQLLFAGQTQIQSQRQQFTDDDLTLRYD